MADITIADKQYMAKILFTVQKLDQKIVAKKVGISATTMSKWVEQFQWKKLRNRLLVSKEEVLSNLYEQLEELNNAISEREAGKRFANTKEADVQVKYTASIRNLETELAIADIVDSGIRFVRFIQQRITPEEVIEIANMWNDFLHEQIKKG